MSEPPPTIKTRAILRLLRAAMLLAGVPRAVFDETLARVRAMSPAERLAARRALGRQLLEEGRKPAIQAPAVPLTDTFPNGLAMRVMAAAGTMTTVVRAWSDLNVAVRTSLEQDPKARVRIAAAE